MRVGSAELLEQLRGPVAVDRIVELARAGLGHLVALHAGQQPVEQVGHHQQRLGHVQQRRAAELHRQQLVERVELHELQAGVAEDLLAADDAEGLFHHAVGAAVAVMIGIAQQLVAAAQQAEIDAPGVDADAGDAVAPFAARGPQALADVGPLAQQVPVQAAGDLDRAVLEAIDLFQPQLLAVEQAQHGRPLEAPMSTAKYAF